MNEFTHPLFITTSFVCSFVRSLSDSVSHKEDLAWLGRPRERERERERESERKRARERERLYRSAVSSVLKNKRNSIDKRRRVYVRMYACIKQARWCLALGDAF